MNLLLIGDLHVKESNLKESDNIMNWILGKAQKHNVDGILFLGDQYNDFGSVRVSVMSFWRLWFGVFKTNKIPIYAIDGNHDMTTDCSYTAMKAHEDQITYTGRASSFKINGTAWMLPFYRNNEDFIKAVSDVCSKSTEVVTIFCHQEIDGAQFENGFYAPHGVKMSNLPKNVNLISGHIHKKQEFGQVWYPGTTRFLTRSDAGEVKGIHIYNTENLQRTFLPIPESVAIPYKTFTIQEGIPQDLSVITEGSRTYVDIKGSSKYIKKTLKSLPNNIIIRTFVEDDSTDQVEIRESDGIAKAFDRYSKKFAEENSLNEDVESNLKRMVFEKCQILKTK